MNASKTAKQTAAIAIIVSAITACVAPQQRAPQQRPNLNGQPPSLRGSTPPETTWFDLPLLWWEDEEETKAFLDILESKTEEELIQIIFHQNKELEHTVDQIRQIKNKQTVSITKQAETVGKARQAMMTECMFLMLFPQSQHERMVKLLLEPKMLHLEGVKKEQMNESIDALRYLRFLQQHKQPRE